MHTIQLPLLAWSLDFIIFILKNSSDFFFNTDSVCNEFLSKKSWENMLQKIFSDYANVKDQRRNKNE